MDLDEYKRKRDFTRTAEPPARLGATATGRSFVVQKHAARRLHYDFRLELDGVLKSWSVPKGPSLDPTVKRLAVAVEDHPIEYGGFEGVIPAGQYGGGTVMVWDRGTWNPLMDGVEGVAAGHLKFELRGEKLRGRWALIRLKPRRRATGGHAEERSWLLVKDRDEYARSETEAILTETRPESVATGRDMDAIAAAPDRVWHSNRENTDVEDLAGARAAAMPGRIHPPLPKRVSAVPGGEAWLHEIAIVGERVLVRVADGRIQVVDSEGADRTTALPGIVVAARFLPAGLAILDGVATALDPDGRSGIGRPADTLYAIDLPYLDGYDLTRAPLGGRKALLASLVAKANAGAATGLRYADHVVGRGREILDHSGALGAPGIVSKRIGGRYGGADWRLVRCPPPSGSGKPIASVAPVARATAPKEVRLAGVKLTHPGRLLYPDAGLTKLDLARFYERVADRMLPYLVDRPLTLVRAPEGMAGKRFFVRHAGDTAPRELRPFAISEGPGAGMALIVDDLRGLIALAQMNVLEIHLWNARTRNLGRPDRVVFDLDPGPEVPWSEVVDGAKRVREVLATLDLASFVKTTGGKGLHVVVPLVPAATWEGALEFSRDLARALARFEPTRFSADLAKAGRTRQIFVDYLRNRRGATSVSAFSTRAQSLATVSVPVAWDALGFATRNEAFQVGDVATWYGPPDPWADFGRIRQRLTSTKIRAARTALGRAPGIRSATGG